MQILVICKNCRLPHIIAHDVKLCCLQTSSFVLSMNEMEESKGAKGSQKHILFLT